MDSMDVHCVRIPDELWERARMLSKAQYISTSALVRTALAQYLARNEGELPAEYVSAIVSNDDWFDNHRKPVHGGYMPIAGTCDYCDEQYKLRGWKG